MANDISFDIGTLKKMETIVLRELRWNIARVTPFNFVPYFFHLLDCYGEAAAFHDSGSPIHSRILREAEVLSCIVLYECGGVVDSKAVSSPRRFCASHSRRFRTESWLRWTSATTRRQNILQRFIDAHADDFASTVEQVILCVRHIEALKETLDDIFNDTSQSGEQAQLQTTATPVA